MSFDEATIMAYVDGECDEVTVNRIEKAMETDPALARRIEQAQSLRNKLSAHYAPVAEEAVPDRLAAMLNASAASNIDSSFTARKAEQEESKQRRRSMGIAQWGAMAATLALGVVVGQYGMGGGSDAPFAQQDGALVASGPLEDALETQLASAQPDDSDYRIGLTFRAKTGSICRSFTGEAVSGIGCRDGQQWKMVSTLPGGNESDYRQASSSAVNAIAAEMMADAPADAEAERKLLESGWE
ncbi:anti-sigma factor [uncultured Parasphingorhabdus sp.]|uniref:anti-sigma factor family protein n=1 Tax=uncultured Parasphingorhabdus sp. TaxID=2709694 RepID=UPI0030DD3CEB|tara:strand:- start:15854 stop:16579 length:726 start_codon:yes stop_codon:yes gene_type:complete